MTLKLKHSGQYTASVRLFVLSVLAMLSASAADLHAAGPEVIIPAPYEYSVSEGSFVLGGGTSFYIELKKPYLESLDPSMQSAGGEDGEIAGLEEELLSLPYGLVKAGKKSAADIVLTIGGVLPDRRNAAVKSSPSWKNRESYRLKVTEGGIRIEAKGFAGAFYAIQSLVQMAGLPSAAGIDDADSVPSAAVAEISCCTVTDSPRFGYRGLHFDVSRHFRSKEFLMKQMDAMALLKLNKMHLHLTDGAGWRIEIDGYPELTEFAAWRPYADWSDWWVSDRHYCRQDEPGAYGGYYTADDIREILAYAAKKHIEVIPEIEMPGHSEEVLAAYPELSCTGKQYGSGDLCPGKEATFGFLEDVLSQVMDLFPSEYVHIGGDEASKGAWKTCPDCQRRMQEEGLENVDELQSYLIHRIEEFVNSKGKKIIGWDEILQGGLAPNATVMSWRGTEGGITAMKSGHDVIMTPGEFCYLDYTQDAPFKEPVSIGGYIPLAKTYSYEPAEDGLTEAELSHLLGVQGNLWAEYIPTDSHAEYMYYPRAYAIAEIGWSKAGAKDYDGFRGRALKVSDMLDGMGFSAFDLRKEYGNRKESLEPVHHLAEGCPVIYGEQYSSQYPASGDCTLTDGVLGGWTYGDRKWQGFLTDMDVTVDLGAVKPVHYVGATFMQVVSAWVWLPEKVEISISDDGRTFRTVGTVWRDMSDELNGLYFKPYGLVCNESGRYVRVRAFKHPAAGAWLFTDEVIVN